MSSSSGARPRPLPRVRLSPRSVSNDADDAAFLSSGYGLTPDDWQEDVLDDWLGRRRDGRWAATTCALAVPRQNGKNGLIEIRELFGMVMLGEKFLHTAHEVKTARKAFIRIASFFENVRQYPELARMVKEIRKTNGQEAVVLDNGGSVEFIARSKGSGRGFTVDVLICDEAQDLDDEKLSALLPTLSAAPLGNPQLILTGTPPDPEKGQIGEVFTRVRNEADAGRNKHLAWTDYGAADGPLPDVDDHALWYAHNPAMGVRVHEGWVAETEHSVMSPEAFARERLGWWGDPNSATGTAFGPGVWESLADEALEPIVGAVGLAVSVDRSAASIGIAGLRGELAIVGELSRENGVGWLVSEAQRIQGEYGCPVALDKTGPTADLIPALEAAGVRLTLLDSNDMKDACAGIFDRAQAGTLAHPRHTKLDVAVAGACKREVGDSGRWLWWRKKSTSPVDMLEAVTAALWVASSRPSRDFWGAVG